MEAVILVTRVVVIARPTGVVTWRRRRSSGLYSWFFLPWFPFQGSSVEQGLSGDFGVNKRRDAVNIERRRLGIGTLQRHVDEVKPRARLEVFSSHEWRHLGQGTEGRAHAAM